MRVTTKIARRERRAIQKLWHGPEYKWILWIFIMLFTPVKKFISLPVSAARKVCGVISLSVYKFLWLRVGYIDDFIVHKKLRWKWYAQQLFHKTQQEAQQQQCDYLILFSRKERKASHRFYKKAGLTIIGLGIGIFAYKKINRKK